MITSTTSGVWILADQYAKNNAERWRPNGAGLFVWGFGTNGQLGLNDLISRSSPTQIPGTQWNDVAYGYQHSAATKTNGTLWVWGINTGGMLGQNDRVSRSSPTQVPGTQWNSISNGTSSNTLATKTDGTLWAWGLNANGQLGQGDVIRFSSPVQIPGTQWNKIEAGGYGSNGALATKTDGTLWAWGYNYYGELGLNDKTPRSSPTQISGTQWNNLGRGQSFAFASKTDGTLWAWGYNASGQIGQNNGIYYSSPRQIPGTQWNLVNGGQDAAIATKTDGTLWVWGNNGGRLGQNDSATQYSSPRQIPGTQWALDAYSIDMGYNHAAARKSDGTLWSWGYNVYGQLGQNTSGAATYRSSPVQIPGTQWISVIGDVYSYFARKISY